MKLDEYNKKRNFKVTKEPKGAVLKRKRKNLKFVVQHHLASRDHFDVRLEYNGVYVSFAVPKGPSFNPKDKRLAVKVEDHPLSYGNFEGVIPKQQYGAGVVQLWDKGYWHPDKSEKVDFNKGPIKFTFVGKRLMGKWTLVKFKEDNWLLIKEKDEYVNLADIKKYTTSITTGRTIKEIEAGLSDDDILITNPNKVIFKKSMTTKKQIADYYKLVAKRMMPFLDKRLISTVRSPEGGIRNIFFMKHFNQKVNKGLNKKLITSKNGEKTDYYYIKNTSGLVGEVQMNSFEFHIWGSKENKIKKPDILVFDLDPDEGLSLKKVREGVLDLKEILDELEVPAYLKTSGGKGYHIYVPLQFTSWKKCADLAKNVAQVLVEKYPDKYTLSMRKKERKGKIFIDYFRNKLGATSVCPYSLRLKNNPTVSCPIFWDELQKIKPDSITINNIKNRLKKEDPWESFFANYN